MNTHKGKVILIPTLLGDGASISTLSPDILRYIEEINHYIVENEKSARRYIKTVCPEKDQSSLSIEILNKRTSEVDVSSFLSLALEGETLGMLSEAGCPAIADPGAQLVSRAHLMNVEVIPLVGPSSILLSLMASGMNGQSFRFHGYLPIQKADKLKAIRNLETEALSKDCTQLFIETPYRNEILLTDLINTLQEDTQLCLCLDMTLPKQTIISKTVKQWRGIKIAVHKRLAIYLVGRSCI